MADSPTAVEHHNPALKHHFVDMEQQREASSLGMWLFLATEIMFFGGMFCAYLIYRYWYFPDFAAASSSLDITLGTVNTAVLICSSLTVVMAVRAAQLGCTTVYTGNDATNAPMLAINRRLGYQFWAVALSWGKNL